MGDHKYQFTKGSLLNFDIKLSQKIPNASAFIGSPQQSVVQMVPMSSITYNGISNNSATFSAFWKNFLDVFPKNPNEFRIDVVFT